MLQYGPNENQSIDWLAWNQNNVSECLLVDCCVNELAL